MGFCSDIYYVFDDVSEGVFFDVFGDEVEFFVFVEYFDEFEYIGVF